MMRVPARRPIFVGCEGGSERNYVRFLGFLADEAGLHVHLEAFDLGGGDAKSAVERAARQFKKYRSDAGPETPGFVLLDTDRTDGQRALLQDSAAKNGLTVIWQEPCHEALLLRHFTGEEHRQPHDCSAATQLLRRFWTSYQKPEPATRIAKVLAIADVRRVAGVTPALQALLDEIKL